MSRSNKTQVERSEFLKVIESLGLNVVERKGFIKVFAAGKNRPPAIGIQNSAKVTLVELVGFEHPVGVAHPKPPASTVSQMLDFSKADVADILKDFIQVATFVANAAGEHVAPVQAEVVAKQQVAKLAAIEEFEMALSDMDE